MGTRDDSRDVSATTAGVLLLVVAVLELLASGYYFSTKPAPPLLPIGSSLDLALPYALIGCAVLFRHHHWRYLAGVAGGLLVVFGVMNLLRQLIASTVWPFPVTLPLLSLLVGLFALFVKRQRSSKDAVSSAGIALIVLGVAILRFLGVSAIGLASSAGSSNVQVITAGAIFIAGLAMAPWWLRLRGLASCIGWSVVTLVGAFFYVWGLGGLQRVWQPVQTSLLNGGPNLALIGAVVSAIVFLCGVATAQRWRTWRVLSALIGWTLVVSGGLPILATVVKGGNAPARAATLGLAILSFAYICGVGVFVLWARRRERTVG